MPLFAFCAQNVLLRVCFNHVQFKPVVLWAVFISLLTCARAIHASADSASLALPKKLFPSKQSLRIEVSPAKPAQGLAGKFSIDLSSREANGAVIVDVTVSEQSGKEIGADLNCEIPILEDWLWWESLDKNLPIAHTQKQQSIYPLAVASNPKSREGFALAITPETPCVFSAGASKTNGLFLRVRVGFSRFANPASKVRLQLAVFPIDGQWGMRSALEKYYSLFPKWYERRVDAQGLWLFFGDATRLPNPSDFAFHEWPSGREPSKETLEFGKKHGLGLYPYVIPGQREISHLAHLRGEEKARKSVKELSQEDNAEHVYVDVRYSTAEAMAVLTNVLPKNIPSYMAQYGRDGFIEVITNSMQMGQDGQVITMPREVPWAGKALTFPLNPNPFCASSNRCIGKLILEEVGKIKYPHAGIYVDSLWRWGNFLNYRADHFAFARYGLTYGPDGRPALDNALEHLTFLEELGKALHPQGRAVFGNGIRPGRFWHAQRLDISGSEMGSGSLESFAFNRAATFQKPYLVLSHNMGKKSEAWDNELLAKCFLFGFYASGDSDFYFTAAYQKVRPVYQRYLPLQKEMTRLGWQPITAATPNPGVRIERFGTGPIVYFAVYDPTKQHAQTTVRLDSTRLSLQGKSLQIEDAFSKKELPHSIREGVVEINPISLDQNGVGALKVQLR